MPLYYIRNVDSSPSVFSASLVTTTTDGYMRFPDKVKLDRFISTASFGFPGEATSAVSGSAWFNTVKLGNAASFSDLQKTYHPLGHATPVGVLNVLERMESNVTTWPSGTTLDVSKTTAAQGAGGWYAFWYPTLGGMLRVPFLIGDRDASGGSGSLGGAGQIWFPHGTWNGTGDTGALNLSLAFREEWRATVPTLSTDRPYFGSTWKNGDRVVKKVPIVEGSVGSRTMVIGWQCTADQVGGVNAGTWTEIRAWAENPTSLVVNLTGSLRNFSVAAGSTVPLLFSAAGIPSGGALYQLSVYARITTTSGSAMRMNYSYADQGGAQARDLIPAGSGSTIGFQEFTKVLYAMPSQAIGITVFDSPHAGCMRLSLALVRLF